MQNRFHNTTDTQGWITSNTPPKINEVNAVLFLTHVVFVTYAIFSNS